MSFNDFKKKEAKLREAEAESAKGNAPDELSETVTAPKKDDTRS